MARPPRCKPLPQSKRICRWTNAAGRTRSLCAEERGQFVQGYLTGFNLRSRYLLESSWTGLGMELQRIVLGWGGSWRLEGVRIGVGGVSRASRMQCEARA